MPVREVIVIPHPTLRKQAVPGLAAPQVNVSQQVILVEYGSEDDEDIPPTLYVAINPKITRFSPETVNGAEGCLSIPNLMGEVERAHEIVVEGLDRHGKPLKMKLHGWVARIFQHEIDHLNGILFTDRATDVWETDENYNPV
ncbi:MAG: peptide deformylase [Anaerolineales bacterium]